MQRWTRIGDFALTDDRFETQAMRGTSAQAMLGLIREDFSLMRLAPVVLFYSHDFEQAIHFAAESSRTTHAATEAVDACRYFAALLFGAIAGVDKRPIPGYWDRQPLAASVAAVARGSYKTKTRSQISSSGYVIHTLEAALWALHRNADFRSGALEAVNLAGDSDTVGAVCGQLVGTYYRETQIPVDWIVKTYASHGCYRFADDIVAVQREQRMTAP